MNYYCEETESVLSALETSAKGLSQAEAEARLQTYGPNKLKEAPKTSLFRRFLSQLSDPMILVLLAAAAVSGITAAYAGESPVDVIVILIVVLINAVLGVIQESKAEGAIEALQKMTAATSKVLRDGEIKVIPGEEVTVGDVILLEAGDSVPADARLLFAASLKAEESALTGESLPVNKLINALNLSEAKDIPLGDRKNMVYSGTTIVYGHGEAVVTAIGMDTEMGKIAEVLSKTEQEITPLQRKLNGLSKVLTKLVLGICVFIFAFSLIRSGSFTAPVILDTFMTAVSLAVAAIPEGLATVVTIVLSIGVTKMSERNAVIRKLTAVETLGSAQIVCSDKTGTLTQNKMTVVETWGSDPKLLAAAMALCNDAEIGSSGQAQGEPTEAGLVNYAASVKIDKNTLKQSYPRVGEAPFDSLRKMMSTVHAAPEGKFIQYTKGAPDIILEHCRKIIRDGEMVVLDDETRREIMSANKQMADRALRVLAAAMVYYDELPESFEPEDLERNMVFIGLTGMIDPIRPEVKDAVSDCIEAGVTPIMITGDHRDTAAAIAKQLGIVEDDSEVMTGAELNELSDEEFNDVIERTHVYARVQPEHKVRIVTTWKKKNRITAMTGDGVNDAPAIKSADIGIGMGITGTDVTKGAADMILADDNFATIVTAIEEGRRIYDNIRKAIQFLLSSNLSEVISIFTATLLGFTILKPVQILWINLITDCFPALALGMEKAEGDLMKRKPRDPNEGIFADGLGVGVIYQGLLTTLLTLVSYFIGCRMESGSWAPAQSAVGMTMAFLTMALAETFHSFNMRSLHHSIFTLKHANNWLLGAGIFSLVLSTIVVRIPALVSAFDFAQISNTQYWIAFGLAFLMIPFVEAIKRIRK